MSFGVSLLSLQLLELAGAAGGATRVAAPAVILHQVSEEELLLYAVELDGLTLTETLTAYGDSSDPLLPVGELARLLDLDISVFPADRRVTGRLGEARRALTVDLALGVARSGGENVALALADVAVSPSDIFIRSSQLQKLLPLTIEADGAALTLKLVATEKLPIQARLERNARAQGLTQGGQSLEPTLQIDSPYLPFTLPGFDIALDTGAGSRSPRFPHRYDVRMAGDLLYSSYNGYIGSDDTGRPSSARLQFERRSRDGGLLGPLDATYLTGGDVFTPALAIGARSGGGRGFAFSTGALEQASVFQRISLRGELPIGYDVELYINDVLRSGQRAPVEGRYEFLDVPLVRGLNVIRVVTYGPRGERDEQTRIINVGGGQLARGETSFDFGIVQQDSPLLDLREYEPTSVILPGTGDWRAIASASYGVSEQLTLTGGAALHPGPAGEERQVASLGARGSLFGMSLQADAAADHKGGRGVALGIAGQLLGASLIARHSEYAGGFVDETLRSTDITRSLTRHSEATLDMSLPEIGGKMIPLSLRAERDAFSDGGTNWLGFARASLTLSDILLSTGLDYQRESRPNSDTRTRLAGNLAASSFVDFKWQLRGVVDYDLVPEPKLKALSATADRNISERLGVRFGIGKSFSDAGDISVQGSGFMRLPFADIALTGDYATAQKAWRIGLRIGFGLAFDPVARRYRMTPPGPAAGGSAVLQAYIDEDADGVRDRDEAPVAKLRVESGGQKTVTGADGTVFVTNLGTSITGNLRTSIDDIDAFYVSAPPPNIEFSPRPGHVIKINYPLVPVAEVVARLSVTTADGRVSGLSAVRVRLVREGRPPISGTTEFDGSVIFGEVPPGKYRFELDSDQAARLGMRLAKPVEITVTDAGAPDITAQVLFQRPES